MTSLSAQCWPRQMVTPARISIRRRLPRATGALIVGAGVGSGRRVMVWHGVVRTTTKSNQRSRAITVTRRGYTTARSVQRCGLCHRDHAARAHVARARVDNCHPASVSRDPGGAVADVPQLLAQFPDAAHRLGLPSPSAPSGETRENWAPLYQWDPLAHRVVGSLPDRTAWRLFDNAGGLGCVCYLRRLYRGAQFHLQPAVVGSGAAADRLYRGAQIRLQPAVVGA